MEIWYLTIHRILVKFEKQGYASILPGYSARDRHEKRQILVSAQYLVLKIMDFFEIYMVHDQQLNTG